MKRRCIVLGLLAVIACSSKFDGTREPVDNGTFGTTVVTLACKRIAYLESLVAFERGETQTVDVAGNEYRELCRLGIAPPAGAPDTLKALAAKRDDLVGAVDAIFPAEFLPDLQAFLTSNDFLAMYDDGTTEHSIDELIELLELMADDDELAPALARLNHRLGYLPITPSLGSVRAVVQYPSLHELTLSLLNAITEGGSARVEFEALQAALSAALRNAEPVADSMDPTRTGQLAIDLLFTESELLGTSKELPIVVRDPRGLATVASAGEALPAPFADVDDDGLADADADGRYLDADGAAFAAPAPFELAPGEELVPWPYRDALGRALVEDEGAPLYRFVDLDRTVMAALTRDAVDLFDPDEGTALDMLRGASLLAGPRVMTERAYADGPLAYRGYDTAQSPLLDVVYGYLLLLSDPNIYDTLGLARQLLRDHEGEAARLIEALVRTARRADSFPNAQLEPGSPLFDDLMPVIDDILATPGLAEDLLRALEAPQVAELGLRFAEQMKYKDVLTYDANQEIVGTLSTPVDRSKADTGHNRSAFQRLAHLVHDTNGAQLCNKQNAVVKDPFIGITLATYDECELLRIDNLAVFYVQSIAWARDGNGNLQVGRPKARFPFDFNNVIIEAVVTDDLLEDESGIEGFRFNPTPQALNRSLFLDPMPEFLADALDPARCIEGDRIIDAHQGTLITWELNGFYDQLRPLAQAFADHDAEQLFVDLLTAVHNHYPSPASTDHQQTNPNGSSYAYASNLVSYEPLFIDILEDRSLMDALVFGAPAINGITVNGRSAVTVLANAARFIFSPQQGLARRDGATATTTEDGRPIDTLSPWYVIAEANQDKRARLAEAQTEGDAWRGAVTNTVDVLLRADAVVDQGWQFRNPRFQGVSVALLDFVEARLRAHDTAGDRQAWLTQELPADIEDLIANPVFAGTADFVVSLQADPEARRQLELLLAYLVDEVSNTDVFWTSLSAAADVLQLALDDRDVIPIARIAGEALRPERGMLQAHLELAKRARLSDENRALARLLQNLFTEHRRGHTAVGDLLDGITEVNRARPYEDLGFEYAAEDYRAAFRGVAEFLGEERRGLRKFIQIIKSRNL